MQILDRNLVIEALRRTGEGLAQTGAEAMPTVRVVVCGAVAGILNGDLAEDRRTVDCDLVQVEPPELFEAIEKVSARVAEQLDLSHDWLNRASREFAYLLPVGWRSRLRAFRTFGPLEIVTISRVDLMAMKLMAMAKRPSDLVDIEAMKPTQAEITFLLGYLDQSEMESLDRDTFDDQRAILLEMRSSREG